MRQWLIDPKNPDRDGNRTFITNWLQKALDALKKTPKKVVPIPASDDPYPGVPYNPSIAYVILSRDGKDEYLEYLKAVSEKKYYNNFLKGVYESYYVSYLEESKNPQDQE